STYATRSPARMPRTSCPAASTVPAPSTPGTEGSGTLYNPVLRYTSMKLTPTASCRTRICPGPGAGVSRSCRRMTSGPPNCSTSISFKAGLYDLCYLAGAKAARADFNRRLGLAYHGLDLQEIRLPHPPCPVLGVADLVPRNRTFSAYVTLACHGLPALDFEVNQRQKHIEKGALCKGGDPGPPQGGSMPCTLR